MFKLFHMSQHFISEWCPGQDGWVVVEPLVLDHHIRLFTILWLWWCLWCLWYIDVPPCRPAGGGGEPRTS